MLGFGKKRKETQRLIATIQSDAKRIREHLAAQSQFASRHLAVPSAVQWGAIYSRAYILGALESLLEDRVLHGRPIEEQRDDILAGLVDSGFVSVTTNAFAIATHEAQDALADLRRHTASTPVRHAMSDGRADGLRMRAGVPALLWLAHFVDTAREPLRK